jgi:hypothetical protein
LRNRCGRVLTRFEERGAKKAWETRRSARYRASKSERASKSALAAWCRANSWKLLFFEGETGAPRTGIVDAITVAMLATEWLLAAFDGEILHLVPEIPRKGARRRG